MTARETGRERLVPINCVVNCKSLPAAWLEDSGLIRPSLGSVGRSPISLFWLCLPVSISRYA
jgi:hypothetical protein